MKKVLIAIGVILILCIGGCLAVTVAFVHEVDKEVTKAEEKDNEPGGPNNPLEIKPGEAFEVSGFEYAPGWTLGADAIGSIEIKGLKVTNNRDKKDSAIVEIKLWRGNEVLGLADCTTEPIAVGTTTTLSCLSGDDMPKRYQRVTINDAF